MDGNMDKVFVQLPEEANDGDPTLEWIFEHIDRDKFKLIILPYSGDIDLTEFKESTESHYLPRCADKKFRAEMLIPNGLGPSLFQELLMDLVTRHGMNKIVTDASEYTIREISDFFNESPKVSCKVWFLNNKDGTLYSSRWYCPSNSEMFNEDQVENEKLKKMIKEETERYKNVENELLSMSNEAKTKEREIDHLRKEIDQLNQNMTLSKSTQNFSDLTMSEEKVFVELSMNPKQTMNMLEWMFDHFDRDKTKIIIVPYSNTTSVDKFRDGCESDYLPRCAEKKFKVDVLIPDAVGHFYEQMVELITKHGMNKFVATAGRWTMGQISKVCDDKPNLSCKVWLLHREEAKLVSTRCYGPCNSEMLEEALVEIEKLKKTVEEETGRCMNVQNELFSMSNQAKINEQEIDRLRQEIDRLQQNKTISTTKFTLEELKHATQNFSISLKIGEGEYACVYKGSLNGTTVAIKKFKSQCKLSLSVLRQEVGILSRVRHPNLVTLIGTCLEPPALVYEFFSRGSLHNYLNHTHNTVALPWQVRTRIIGEVCRALIFLHSKKPNPIVHGDLRPDNILLDGDFTCKLSNFGLIKKATRTLAYMDPEYLTTEKMTQESDVFSFGVLILHLLTGKSRLNISKHVEEETNANDNLRIIIDESAGKWPIHHAEEVAKIGIWCADAQRKKRPDLVNDVWPIVECLMRFPNEIIHERWVYMRDN